MRYGARVSPSSDATLDQPTEPLDVDGVAVMTIGTVLWGVALVVLLATGIRPADDNGWYLGVCIAGMGMGALGIIYTRRRRAVYRAAAAERQPGAENAITPDSGGDD